MNRGQNTEHRTQSTEYSEKLRNGANSAQSTGSLLYVVCCLLSVFCVLCSALSSAEEPHTIITSDSLEYFSETKTYTAKGSVAIEREDAFIKADEVIYYEETSDITAEGNVLYEDTDTSITARKAEMNLKEKTGKLYDAEFFHKKENYYLSGKEIERRGKDYYYSPKAVFTTCNPPVPAWCFRGKKVDAVIGKRLKAKDVSFRIKGIPVLYTPYLRVPLITKRQTGLLMPLVSQSKSRGVSLKIPFFWAISQNRDATFILDMYSKRGKGAGIEYRFIKPGGIKSNWWAYHIKDSELNKDFWEINALHEDRYTGSLGGFLNINFVNEKDFYREFSPYFEIRTQRFLESTGEINALFTNSRLYLLSQYWIDLKYDTGDIPQRLPEAGYILNYSRIGGFMFSSSVTAANIWREDGISAKRLDIYPKLLYSRGNDYVVSQMAAIRGTAYSFYRNSDITDDSMHRLAFEYDIIGNTRLFRNYRYFMHVAEPSIRYHFISSSENGLPVFDSYELFEKTSRIEFSLLNRLIVKGSEVFTSRITQGIETYNGDRPFLPLKIEVGIKKPLPLKIEAEYDVHTGKVETVSSDLSFRLLRTEVSVGQRYNRKEDIMLYRAGAVLSLIKSLQMAGSLWYDAKGDGVRDIILSLRYLSQCWGIKFEYTKRPGDYTMAVMFELKGLFSNITNR